MTQMPQRKLSLRCAAASLAACVLLSACSKAAEPNRPGISSAPPEPASEHVAKAAKHPIGAWRGTATSTSAYDEAYEVLLSLNADKSYWRADFAAATEDVVTTVSEGTWSFSNGRLTLRQKQFTTHSEASALIEDEPLEKKYKSTRSGTAWKLRPDTGAREERSDWTLALTSGDAASALAQRDTWIKRARRRLAEPAAEAARTANLAASGAPTPSGSMYSSSGAPCSGPYTTIDSVCVHQLLAMRSDVAELVANYKRGVAPPPLP
jgi:hypothetical protein